MLGVLEAILWIIRFLFGACIFSFFVVVADRLPRGESVVSGRSHCTTCGKELGGWELIPFFSFLALKGRCKGCGAKIPRSAFLGETAGGVAFIVCGIYFGFGSLGILSLKGLVSFFYLGILLIVALIDWDTQIIYDRFHLLILLLAILNIWLSPEHGIVDRLIGAVIISVPMLVLALLIPGAFGGGDIKLMAVSGLFLGTAPIVCGMFFGLLGGGLYGIWMLKSKKLERKDHFAFGPFLAAGLAVAMFWGDAVVRWYLQFL